MDKYLDTVMGRDKDREWAGDVDMVMDTDIVPCPRSSRLNVSLPVPGLAG
jgi:hypothetical protein